MYNYGTMSELAEDIRCYFDPEKLCPLRAAVHMVQAAREAPEGERMSTNEYGAVLERAAASLSKPDLERYYGMINEDKPTEDIRPGTCKSGPARRVPVFGKMTCGAAAVHYVSPNGRHPSNGSHEQQLEHEQQPE